ncbi:hypothetical protein GOA99_22835, partial [Sinorhizobium meliloti]|nr:hypothetical protein [Sinorhizobium meliloti]MDW9438388.1 hypothetical protein [Sinorhizobium meliloti]MDW9619527.1 hypothetical protein [Sinorhizobium meliloti]MDW9626392.1 hypothetical protein [Sinorhizobium meliloti]MDW9997200.1 hypothetical protein [Sinorhizobium meliloti]
EKRRLTGHAPATFRFTRNFPRTALRLRGEGAGRRMRGNLLHVSFNPIRLKDKNMQQIKVLQRPLRVS